MTPDFRADRVGTALAGTNPTVLRRLRAGFAVIGDNQHLPGYCVLLSDTPGVDQLTDLPPERQLVFLEDMAILGRAVSAVCARRDPDGFRRINLEIQGNTDAFLHAHVTPRYHDEPAAVRGWPAALWHWENLVPAAPALDPSYDELRRELGAEIDHQLALAAD
ncbi:diadenosine tetraphosphate hydrolase [Nocardioides sp. W7]|uniref:HIT family protein n=1 Tax=Nocardioides sp. W7 TaxID=2931390 RepID=UPI001FD02C10|nr:diadenosine tetraphosphate hydrolase [Nocardioides sp. W7]